MPTEGWRSRQGERERQGISVLKLIACEVPVLQDTCDFNLLFFNVRVCYAIHVIVGILSVGLNLVSCTFLTC